MSADEQRMWELSLGCFLKALRCFPTIITRVGGSGGGASALSYLMQRFRQIMLRITASHSKLGTDSQTQQRGVSRTAQETPTTQTHTAYGRLVDMSIFQAMESILLSIAVLLPSAYRNDIEIECGRGLYCLCKGAYATHLPDRHNQRTESAEILRGESSDYQSAFVSLCTVEVLTPKNSDGLSGNGSSCMLCSSNGSLVRQACESLLGSTSPASCLSLTGHSTGSAGREVIMKSLLLLESLNHPYMMPLVSVSAYHKAQDLVSEANVGVGGGSTEAAIKDTSFWAPAASSSSSGVNGAVSGGGTHGLSYGFTSAPAVLPSEEHLLSTSTTGKRDRTDSVASGASEVDIIVDRTAVVDNPSSEEVAAMPTIVPDDASYSSDDSDGELPDIV